MIPVKEAAAKALAYVKELYPPDELRLLRVEEVERSDDGRSWWITVGWVERVLTRDAGIFHPIIGNEKILPRVYKRLAIDRESGEVLSMKIREIAE